MTLNESLHARLDAVLDSIDQDPDVLSGAIVIGFVGATDESKQLCALQMGGVVAADPEFAISLLESCLEQVKLQLRNW